MNFIFLKYSIYLFIRDTEREAEIQREKLAPRRESDVGLDPRTPEPPWAEGRRPTAEPPRGPGSDFYYGKLFCPVLLKISRKLKHCSSLQEKTFA